MDLDLIRSLIEQTQTDKRPPFNAVVGILIELEANADTNLDAVLKLEKAKIGPETMVKGERFASRAPLAGFENVSDFLHTHAKELNLRVG